MQGGGSWPATKPVHSREGFEPCAAGAPAEITGSPAAASSDPAGSSASGFGARIAVSDQWHRSCRVAASFSRARKLIFTLSFTRGVFDAVLSSTRVYSD